MRPVGERPRGPFPAPPLGLEPGDAFDTRRSARCAPPSRFQGTSRDGTPWARSVLRSRLRNPHSAPISNCGVVGHDASRALPRARTTSPPMRRQASDALAYRPGCKRATIKCRAPLPPPPLRHRRCTDGRSDEGTGHFEDATAFLDESCPFVKNLRRLGTSGSSGRSQGASVARGRWTAGSSVSGPFGEVRVR